MAVKYFFDIPVYRLPRERYYREREEYVNRRLFPEGVPLTGTMRQNEQADPYCYAAAKDHLQRIYGGCWPFNEIIGYIRLHFLGSQVRGEYFGVRKKRIVRNRNKTFEYLTWKLTPEEELPDPLTSDGIYQAILEYLSSCRRELPSRHIDTDLFEVVGKHIDWLGLFKSE